MKNCMVDEGDWFIVNTFYDAFANLFEKER